jgi:hypothetical protein
VLTSAHQYRKGNAHPSVVEPSSVWLNHSLWDLSALVGSGLDDLSIFVPDGLALLVHRQGLGLLSGPVKVLSADLLVV